MADDPGGDGLSEPPDTGKSIEPLSFTCREPAAPSNTFNTSLSLSLDSLTSASAQGKPPSSSLSRSLTSIEKSPSNSRVAAEPSNKSNNDDEPMDTSDPTDPSLLNSSSLLITTTPPPPLPQPHADETATDILESLLSSPGVNQGQPQMSASHLDLSEEALLASDSETQHSHSSLSSGSQPMEISSGRSSSLDLSATDNVPFSSRRQSPSPVCSFSTPELVNGPLIPCDPFPVRSMDPIPVGKPSTSRGRGASTRAGRGRGRGSRMTRSNKNAKQRKRASQPGDLLQKTPIGYRSYLSGLHPWADLVVPRPMRHLRELNFQVSNVLSPDHYRQLPKPGYLNQKFARSLFPRITFAADIEGPVPFIELQHIEDAVAFRQRAEQVMYQVLSNTYNEVDTSYLERQPLGEHPTVLAPPLLNNVRPVLYQVVSTGWGTGIILEAKDFFVFGPDRLELHCITLDNYGINVLSNYRGFDKGMVAVKDFVWVYDVKPSVQALRNPEGALRQSRDPRTTALENTSTFFFRADTFAFVTPHRLERPIYGIVLFTTVRRNRIQHFRATFQGAPDTVAVGSSACGFNLQSAHENLMLLAESRHNVSCAVRFSEPPISVEARNQLCRWIRRIMPMHPDEGLLPITVHHLPPQEVDFLDDRARRFQLFLDDTPLAKQKMCDLFNVACSALASINSLSDDRQSHWVTASVPNMTAGPIVIDFELHEMATEAGWTVNRPVILWIAGSSTIAYTKVRALEHRSESKILAVSISAFPWSHGSIMRNIQQFARRLDGATFLDICVRLGKPLITADPAYECVSRMDLYEELKRSTTAGRIIETTYGLRFLDCTAQDAPALFGPINEGYSCSLKGREVVLTEDQHKALALALSDLPIVAIQAAFGTGKTVVGALAAALIARTSSVLVTASTNAAVAQFAETLLALDNQNHLAVVRYLADTAAAENNSPTSADLGELLKGVANRYAEHLTPEELDLCSAFLAGREVLERYLDDPDLIFRMTEEDREEYFISERFVSRNLQKMVDLLFRLMRPNVILATTSSMLNISGPGGIFRKHMEGFKVLIGDEASQIPEPVLMALAVRLPARRHVYIGDVHQLEPHAKWPRSSNPVRFGAQSVMSVLTRARAVPVAPLLTTFRAHPDLIELPNRVAYDGELVSGLRREDRQMLLSVMTFPHPSIPFMFVDVPSTSTRAASKSLCNEAEALACWDIVDRLFGKGITADAICIITFYREQYRRLFARAMELGVDLSTVDSVQGREKEVVIILTTRTNVDPNSAEFLDDYRRMNVAISRCRHGQFILGHVRMLQKIPYWNRVIRWSTSIGAVVSRSDLSRYF